VFWEIGWQGRSDLVALDAKQIGVLYEKENYSKIVFTTCNWK